MKFEKSCGAAILREASTALSLPVHKLLDEEEIAAIEGRGNPVLLWRSNTPQRRRGSNP